MNRWDGGTQSYLNSRFMLGHLRKNYRLLFDHGIHPDGSYLDVFGYVPPDEDFNREHPTTRGQAIHHELLSGADPSQRRERTTFADGTTVVVDWASGTVSVTPGK